MLKDYTDTFDSKKFTYNKDDRKFVSEASDLGIRAGMLWPYMFFIENAETKKRALFTYDNTVRDDEGDVMCGNYKSTSNLGEFTAIIFKQQKGDLP